MKKLIASLTLTALTVMTLGPGLAVANTTVSTGLIKGSGGGSSPIIKVKWEMLNLVEGAPGVAEGGKDDSLAPGAQFMPPGVWDGQLKYTVCAIATDPNGVADIDGVYAEIFYPADRAYSEDPANPDVLGTPGPGGGDKESPGVGACGAFIEQNTLIQLSKAEGYELFCNQVKNKNNNLPVFNPPYTYDEICAVDGELMKETAYVYCDDKTLKWEDPAGDYKVVAYAQDKAGNLSNFLENYFEYLALTGFEKDFTNVNYGEVLLSTPKKISGDTNFGTADKPTIRNTGNTRLNMKVSQDDMGFGKSGGLWNINFDARVGTDSNDWEVYDPFGFKGATPVYPTDYTQLEDIVELSEIEEMDFSVHIEKWLVPTEYSGSMWLAANMAPFRICP